MADLGFDANSYISHLLMKQAPLMLGLPVSFLQKQYSQAMQAVCCCEHAGSSIVPCVWDVTPCLMAADALRESGKSGVAAPTFDSISYCQEEGCRRNVPLLCEK